MRTMRFAFLATVLSFAGTQQAHAYRTTADVDGFEGQVASWPTVEVTVGAADASPELLLALRGALSVWSADCWAGPSLSEEPDVVVEWVEDWSSIGVPFNEAGSTEVRYEQLGNGWVIQHALVQLNASLILAQDLSLQGVLAHELGHAFGLLHSCGDEGAPQCTSADEASLMHPLYDASRAALGDDDRSGICALFASLSNPAVVGEVGDVCTSARECRTNICGAGGLCASACRAGSCDRGFQCEAGICETARAGFGESCVAGADCATGLCIAQESGNSCTRDCGSGCPAATQCEAVDGRAVCEPSQVDGCSAAPTTTGGSMLTPLLFLLAASSLRRRRSASGSTKTRASTQRKKL